MTSNKLSPVTISILINRSDRFELYYVGFGQAIASFSPNELLASLLVPVFFLFVVAFCGVVVPYAGIPTFWHFVYRVSPFTYLLEGFLGVLVHDVPVVCTEKELARIPKPPTQTCQEYASAFIRQAGGYVQQVGDECRFCQYRNGDEFVSLKPLPDLERKPLHLLRS